MNKYIKLDDVIHNINLEVIGRKEYTGDMKANLFFALDELPTIDIVRCKDCKHNPKRTNNFAYGRCVCCCEDDWYGYVPDDDFFCGHGERIEK